jgi:signal transduction histidine kinase
MLQAAKDIASIINNANNIQTAVERVSRIVFSLTSFEQDDAPTPLVATDLIGNIESAIALYQSRIQQGTQLVRQYTPLPALPCMPEKLVQVWSNLIFNALQAMQFAGTLTIDVSMQNNHAVVVFTDTGCGMAEGLQNDIFKPFFTTKPAGEGSGLGLFTALKIIEKHYGTLQVHSAAQQGATFTVHLPYPASSTPTGTEVTA